MSTEPAGCKHCGEKVYAVELCKRCYARDLRGLPPSPERERAKRGEAKRGRTFKLEDGQYEMMRMLAESQKVSITEWLEAAIDERAERQMAASIPAVKAT